MNYSQTTQTWRESYPTDLAAYRDLVGAIVGQGYRCVRFDDFDPAQRHLILRHDVDLDLQSAVAMAQAEGAAGWRATYFVLLGSEFYNVLSAAGRRALEAIASNGHDIGLHFDRANYAADADLERAAAQECELLEGLLGRPVKVTAAHRPAATWPELLGSTAPFAGRPHAYQARFFSDAGYVADSSGRWSYGHPLDHPALGAGSGLQLLTHPYLWTLIADPRRDARIGASLARRAQVLEAEACRNFSGFEPLKPTKASSARPRSRRD